MCVCCVRSVFCFTETAVLLFISYHECDSINYIKVMLLFLTMSFIITITLVEFTNGMKDYFSKLNLNQYVIIKCEF